MKNGVQVHSVLFFDNLFYLVFLFENSFYSFSLTIVFFVFNRFEKTLCFGNSCYSGFSFFSISPSEILSSAVLFSWFSFVFSCAYR